MSPVHLIRYYRGSYSVFKNAFWHRIFCAWQNGCDNAWCQFLLFMSSHPIPTLPAWSHVLRDNILLKLPWSLSQHNQLVSQTALSHWHGCINNNQLPYPKKVNHLRCHSKSQRMHCFPSILSRRKQMENICEPYKCGDASIRQRKLRWLLEELWVGDNPWVMKDSQFQSENNIIVGQKVHRWASPSKLGMDKCLGSRFSQPTSHFSLTFTDGVLIIIAKGRWYICHHETFILASMVVWKGLRI